MPDASVILTVFAKLKNDDSSLVLRRLNGHYYVYRSKSTWDKVNKRVRTKQEYVGRITAKGRYIRRSESWADVTLKKAAAIVQSYGGRVTFPEKNEKIELAGTMQESGPQEVDSQILTILSMNARASVSFIAKKTGLTRSVVETKMNHFEEQLGLQYLLELDVTKLGFRSYLVLAKFEGESPSPELLQELIRKEPHIQYAALLKGDYDLMMYWLDEIESLDIASALWRFQTGETLRKYNMKVDITPFGLFYSFIPLREEFVEQVLKNRIWQTGRVHQSLKEKGLRQREFAVIAELNKNSAKDFAEIDAERGLVRGGARYAYLELKRRGIIIRPTISLGKLPIKYTTIILSETVNVPDADDTNYKYFEDIIGYRLWSNRYALIGNIGMSMGSIFFMPVYYEGDLERTLASWKEMIKGTVFKSLIITRTLVGRLTYRRFDDHYSTPYSRLVSLKKARPVKLENYDEKY